MSRFPGGSIEKDKNRSQKQSFLEGALILMLANVMIKLIGAVFKIPLKNLIGGDGMGIYNTAYTPYAFLLTIATAGIPIAVSRMVAEANALGKTREIKRIFLCLSDYVRSSRRCSVWHCLSLPILLWNLFPIRARSIR